MTTKSTSFRAREPSSPPFGDFDYSSTEDNKTEEEDSSGGCGCSCSGPIGATDVETERIFKECGEEIPMDVSLVGPNVPTKTFKTFASRSPLCDDYGPKGCVHVAERERCLFHERRGLTCCDTKKEREREGRDEQQQQQHDVCEYDCAFAFNAGVWGYDSWMKSLRRAVERYPKMPVVVTAYSMKECEMDEDCVREAFEEEEIRFVWEAEENKHHGEKVGGEENGRENSAWMCFVSNSGE